MLNNPEFFLTGADPSVVATGKLRLLESGGIESLASRVQAFFDAVTGGPEYLVGAIPFDRMANDFLYQPEQFSHRTAGPGPSDKALVGAGWDVKPEPAPDEHARIVDRCLQMIAEDGVDSDPLVKVVLSRSLRVTSPQRIPPKVLLSRLAVDRSVTSFLTPLDGDASRWLVGASPELLVSKRGREITSHPLAGSARRYHDGAADRLSGEKLLSSQKDRHEHNVVIEDIADVLSPYCENISMPEGTTLKATASMWHLGTRIRGRLKDPETPVAHLLNLLHPTPAVCGAPRDRAQDAISKLETHDRGFYAGAVGWMDAEGDGDWYVSLRCAELAENTVRLFAGGGIVAGSCPEKELDETSAKFQAMLVALGIDESGSFLKGEHHDAA